MKRGLVFGFVLVLFMVGFISAINETNCTVKEDCYPVGFVPSDCGIFYSCVNEICASGSNVCSNETVTVGCASEGNYIYNDVSQGPTSCCFGLISQLVTGGPALAIGRCIKIENRTQEIL